MAKNPGIVSDNPFKAPSVSRSDMTKNTVNVPIKGGIKVVNSIPKSGIRRPK